MEHLIQLVASLPCPSPLQTSMTNSFIGTLWNVLRHPPLSYVGDEFTYRAADGSNNVQYPSHEIDCRIYCILILERQGLHTQRVLYRFIPNWQHRQIQEPCSMV